LASNCWTQAAEAKEAARRQKGAQQQKQRAAQQKKAAERQAARRLPAQNGSVTEYEVEQAYAELGGNTSLRLARPRQPACQCVSRSPVIGRRSPSAFGAWRVCRLTHVAGALAKSDIVPPPEGYDMLGEGRLCHQGQWRVAGLEDPDGNLQIFMTARFHAPARCLFRVLSDEEFQKTFDPYRLTHLTHHSLLPFRRAPV
jgi:hypothetical protein